MQGFGTSYALGCEEVCGCTLEWWSRQGRQTDVDLAVYLLDGEGDLLEIIDGRLDSHAKKVSDQWSGLGIRHFGDTKASQQGKEEVSIDLKALTANASITQSWTMLLVVRVHTVGDCLADLDAVSVSLSLSKQDLLKLTLNDTGKNQIGLPVVLTKADKENSWAAVCHTDRPGFLPLPAGDLPRELVRDLLQHCKWKHRESLIQQHELQSDYKSALSKLQELIVDVMDQGGSAEDTTMRLVAWADRLQTKQEMAGSSHSASSCAPAALPKDEPKPAVHSGGSCASSASRSAGSTAQPKTKTLEHDTRGASPSFEPPLRILSGMLPFRPRSGPTRGGVTIQWQGDDEAPWGVEIGNRPCAALDDGAYVIPRGLEGAQTIVVVMEDGKRHPCAEKFTYWRPGEFHSLSPDRASLVGGCVVNVFTSDLGAPISDVLFDGVAGTVGDGATTTAATVTVPQAADEGAVRVEVRAENGNAAVSLDGAFFFYEPVAFGLTGSRVQLEEDGRRATRKEGVNGGVCIGAYPLRRIAGSGRYFEVRLLEKMASTKTGAFGMMLAPPEDVILREGQLKGSIEEARQLPKTWLVGYDNKGVVFINDGKEEKLSGASWRPIKDIKEERTQIGVLWTEGPEPAMVIYQDGQEKVSCRVGGELPNEGDGLYAVVDVQGSIKKVELVEGALPPEPEKPIIPDEA
mmetsp:Transcript_34713/g.63416  ORF Transcript_34713/g.63416 Transcript_34713/m.63416 type:complete len:688 (+) Transcript_34713:43-2106(+)